jgi:hypothetical protein
VLDADMAQYIHDNTDDEFTHQNFLNAYLALQRGGHGKSRALSHTTGQYCNRIERANAAHKPNAADLGHQLVDPLPQQYE